MGIGIGILLLVIGLILLFAIKEFPQSVQDVVDPDLAAESLIDGPSPLTGRERELLTYALDGSTVATIAARVHLSEGTVRNHLSAAIGKTGATTRSEAARIAQDRGWL